MKKIAGFLVWFFLSLGIAIGQTPGEAIQINSGNPNFPFPQFLEYKEGKSLAKYNAEGVTHADMEKAMREAWRVFANEFEYTGEAQGGVKYIRGNLGCPYDCTEGSGYSLLGAAYMADKTTFDGLWMRTHDHFMVKDARYQDGVVHCPNYKWGKYTLAEACDQGSAGDGDWDVGLALLIAYKQWGTSSGITVKTATGTKQMNYLEEAVKVISSFVDTTRGYSADGQFVGYNTGSIGMDAYPKGGNKQKEATNWNNGRPLKINSEVMCGSMDGNCPADYSFASYIAPAYYRSFADFLASSGGTAWCIEQYRRAEASTTWLMGEVAKQNRLPYLGKFLPNNTGVEFGEYDPAQGKADGESFRMAWRTILDGLWRGDARYNWNPATHQYSAGSNTFMKQNADKVGNFLKDPGICASLGSAPDPVAVTVNYKGVSQIRQYHLSDGSSPSGNWTNYTLGSSSAAVALHGDEGLAAQIYRQLELKWDDKNTNLPASDTVITKSTPKYFHGWFRLLGMLTLTGNYHAPENVVHKANMKVYLSVDKTFAFVGDELTYTVSYRNYGRDTATNVVIDLPISSQYQVVSNGGGSFAGGKLTFNIGNVPGFKTATGIAPTIGTRTFKVKIISPKSVNLVQLNANIQCSNGFGWTSNEYPNNLSYSMQINRVDILGERSLKIEKTANKTEVNPGNNVDFTLSFENSTDAGWLNGGRKNVNFSYAYSESGPNSYFHLFRNWNNAEEAYIDLSNYRVSFFMFDNVNKGVYNATTNPTGWSLIGKNLQTGQLADFKFKGEKIPQGDDNGKKWDQRLMIQFPPDITAPTHTVMSHLNNRFQLHKGTLFPIWYSVQMESNPASPLFAGRIQDDWSFISTDFKQSIGSGKEPYFLIGPNYADINKPGVVMDRFDKDACTAFFTPDKIYNKLLVEEFDGYTWRRIAGEGPLPGREMYNVTVVDTIPLDFQFVAFVDDDADGIKAQKKTVGTREVIIWTVPKVLVGMKGDLKYTVKAKGTCPGMADKNVKNIAYIFSDTDSPLSDTASVKITCSFIVPPIAATTMTKKADKTSVAVGDKVTYTIDFEQTLGTISVPALNDAARWSPIDGTGMPKFTTTAIDFDAGIEGMFIEEKYSHGKNGTLIAEIDHDGQEVFGLVFRHTGGSRISGPVKGLYLEVQLAYWGNQANIKLYQDGVLKASITQEAYAAPFDKATIKVELTDGEMKLWLNDITGLPFHAFTSITNLDPGYVGFAVGDKARTSSGWSKPKILKWNAHFDSAFDVEISDPMIPEATFVSASNGGLNTAGRVSWPKIAGPMLYGEKLKYTMVTQVASCPSSAKLINNAYVNLFNTKKDSVGAQAVSTCGTLSVCEAPNTANLTAGALTICNGSSTTLTVATDAKTGDLYTWYKDGAIIYNAKADMKSISVTQAGVYYVEIADDVDPSDPDCKLASNTLTISASPAVVPGVISAAQTICAGGSPTALTGTASTGGSGTRFYKWESSTTAAAPWKIEQAYGSVTGFAPGVLTTTTHYRRIDSAGTCNGVATTTITITVNPAAVTPGTISTAQSICSGSTPVALTGTASTGGSGTRLYKWESSATGAAPWKTEQIYGSATGFAPGILTTTTHYRRIDSLGGSCNGVATNTIIITVSQSIVPGTISSLQTICSGAIPTALTGTVSTGGSGTRFYKWESSNTGAAPWKIEQAYGSVTGFAPGVLTTTTHYRRIDSLGACAGVASNVVIITVTPPVVAGTIGESQSICAGSTPVAFTGTASTGGSGTRYYKWESSGIAANSWKTVQAYGLTTGFSPGPLNETTFYRRIDSAGTCNGVSTDAFIILVNATLVPGVISSNQQICSGSVPNKLTGTLPSGGDNINYFYQWQFSVNNGPWQDINLATAADYTPPALTATTQYRRAVTSGSCPVQYSNVVTITIGSSVTSSVTIDDPGQICEGQIVKFTATPVGGGATPSYQWYNQSGPILATDSVYVAFGLQDGNEVFVIMTSSLSCATGGPVTSNKVIAQVVNNLTAKVELNTPAPVCEGTTVKFIATSENEGANPQYRWFVNGTLKPGINGTEYSDVFTSTDKVTVELTSDASCVASKVVLSDEASVIINPKLSPSVTIKSSSTAICDGESVTFQVDTKNGEGATPVYQWYVNTNKVGNGATTYTTSTIQNNDIVKVELTSSDVCANPLKVESNPISMVVNTSLTPSVTIEVANAGSTTVCAGEDVQLEIKSSAALGISPSYQWKVSGADKVNTADFTYPNPTDGDIVTLEVSNLSTCANATTVVSNPINLTVKPLLTPSVTISAAPSGKVCAGEPISFTILSKSSEGTSPQYQWLLDGAVNFNENGAVYTSTNLKDGEKVSLRMKSNESCLTVDEVESAPYQVQIVAKPQVSILSSTGKNEFCPNSLVELSAATNPSGAYTYNWKKSGVDFKMNAGSSIIVGAGEYSVEIVTPENCSSVSLPFTTWEAVLPDLTLITSGNTLCPGSKVTLMSSVTNPAYTYTWLDATGAVVSNTAGTVLEVDKGGEYRIAVDYGSCKDTSVASIVNAQSPAKPSFTGPANPNCMEKGVVYSIVSPDPDLYYVWTGPGQNMTEGQSSFVLDLFNYNGKVTVYARTPEGCESPIAELDVTLKGCGLKADFVADKTSVCEGASVTFRDISTAVSPTSIYEWNFGAQAMPSSANTAGPHTVLYSNPGQYSVSLTVTEGLEDVESKSNYIIVNPKPNVSSIGGSSNACENSEVEYWAVSPSGLTDDYTFNWSITGGEILSGQGTDKVTVKLTTTGTANLTLNFGSKAQCGAGIISKNITVTDSPALEIVSSKGVICQGTSVKLSLVNAPSGNIQWKKNGQVVSQGKTEFDATDAASYQLVLDNGTCSASSNVIILNHSAFEINAGPDLLIEQGASAIISTTANESVSKYAWSPKGVSAVAEPTVRPTYTTTYIVEATSESGCADKDTVVVTVVKPLFIPNAFTPNGDGVHDYWEIDGLEKYDRFELQIFNRWGNLVYESNEIRPGWDGKFNSTDLPVGTYYYVIKLTQNGKSLDPVSGSVLLAK